MQSKLPPPLREHIKILSGYPFVSQFFSNKYGMPLIRIRDLLAQKTETYFIKSYPLPYIVHNGDILIGMDGDFNIVRWQGGNALLNQRVCKVTSDSPDLDEGFLFYWLQPKLLEIQQRTSQTTVKHLSISDIEQISMPIFSSFEQCYIAQILDNLDTQIQETKRLISKLKQVKGGLLHDLLTKGIDENGEVRDPVVHPEQFKEVFREKVKIPKEWRIYPLQKIAEIGSGVTLGRNLIGSNTIELPYLRVANVQDGYLNLSEMKTVRVLKDEVHHFLLQPGDVLMTEGGDFDKLGRGTVWTEEISPCLHQNHIFRVRTNRDYLDPDYLALVSSSSYGRHFFLLSSKQSTNLASINSTQLKAFPIPCPPKREQERILEVLNLHDARISAEESHLNKLQQIKKGLMHDLLTGTVRVASLVTTGEQ